MENVHFILMSLNHYIRKMKQYLELSEGLLEKCILWKNEIN